MFDSHIHTKFSTDSRMNIEEAIEKAKGLDMGLIITEHMDLDYPIEGKFVFDPDIYFKEYGKYRNDKLLLGIEMGMQECCTDENRRLLGTYNFDYIIGSIHLVDGVDVYLKEFFEGRKKNEAYTQYLNSMLMLVKECDFINSLGHIDYISRYAIYDDNEMYYEDYCDMIDEVLGTIIGKDIALELNTKRISDKTSYDNIKRIFKRYYELGGRIATIGSDSHFSENIGKEFKAAEEMLDSCSIKPVYYKEREVQYLK